jgi:hypothetical protein
MSSPVPPTPSRSLSLFMGILAAFASFAVLAAVLQFIAGGKPGDERTPLRLQNKADITKEQSELVAKYGLSSDSAPVISKALEQIKIRKPVASNQVVPGSPTALKAMAAPAPAPAATTPAAPVSPAPAPPAVPPAPAPAPAPPTVPAPATPAVTPQ